MLKTIQAQNKEMQFNHALLETLFNTIPSPLFYKDREGVYQNCNSAFSETILNIPKRDIIGKTLYDFPEEIPHELADIYKQKDDEVYYGDGSQYYESKVKCSDGMYRDFSFRKVIVMSDNGEALGILGVMLDITELKKKEKELKELASHDSLTNLYNRRYFSQTSEHILSLAKREKFNLSVVMLDIDNFKSVNDTYGHKIGDDVIVALSNILLNNIRDSDIACRFGGEEFLLLLQKTDLEGAKVIAEKIRMKIASLEVQVEGSPSVTFFVSIGVSEVKAQSEVNVEKAIKRADDALYEAKQTGKNRVCSN